MIGRDDEGEAGAVSPRPDRRTAWGWRHRYGWGPYAVVALAIAAGTGGSAAAGPLPVVAATGLIAGLFGAVGCSRWPGRVDRLWAGGAAGLVLLVVAAVAAGAATGPVAVVAVIAATAVRFRLRRDPRVRDRLRREQIAGWWPEYAAAAYFPGVRLRGGRVEAVDTGWRLALLVPWGASARILIGSEAAWVSALHLDRGTVQIERDPVNERVAYLHVALRDPVSARAADDADAGSVADVLSVGTWDDGPRVRIRLFQRGIGAVHTLIVGATRAGKSGIVNRILWRFARCADVVLFGGDGKGGAELGPWGDLFEKLVTEKDPNDFAEMMIGLRAVVDARGELAAKMRWRVWRPSRRWPAICVTIDESAEFFAAGRPYTREVREAIESIARRGAAFGVFLIIATQYGLAGAVGGSTVRKQCTLRVCFRTNELSEAGFALRNSRGINTVEIPVSRKGTGYLEGDEDARGTMRFRTEWITDEERDATVAEWGPRRTRLDPESRQAYDAAIQTRRGEDEPQVVAGPAPVIPRQETPTEPVERLVVLDRARPRIRPMPPAPPAVPDPDAVFRQLVDEAGERGVSNREVRTAVGKERTWVNEHLIGPAMLAGEVEQIGAGPTTRYRKVQVRVPVGV